MALALASLSVAALRVVGSNGWTLSQGDAEAHLMIGRRLIDGRNAGYDQIGTVWLPLLHLMMIPFVRVDAWWRTGIAGAIPCAIAYVTGGVFFFAAARRLFDDLAAAIAAAAIVALNPNMLYLQSVPMTEALFYAALAGIFYFSVRFGQTRGFGAAAGAGVACCLGALARYDAWFILPFAALYFLIAGKRRGPAALVFVSIAALAPAAWAAHNWWETGDWLDFYRGPYSAKAIQGSATYPGLHDWTTAILYYRTAAGLIAGWSAPVLGLVGIAVLLWRRAFWPVALLFLPAVFYVLSMHSGGTPVFVPTLWPHSYYNTRYGIAVLPLLALGAAALVLLAPARWRAPAAVAVVGLSVIPWVAPPDPHHWAALEESQQNDRGRRAWEDKAADFLAARRVPGESIITGFYPLTGVLREMGVPLREALIGDNGIYWEAAVQRPDFFLTQTWALCAGGDRLQSAILRAGRFGINYDLEARFIEKNEQVIEIYRRVAPRLPVEEDDQ